MSDQIFNFEPDLVEGREYSLSWRTLTTGFDSGTSQYQSELSRQIYDFKFVYRGYHEDVTVRRNMIEVFFNAHRGMGDSFYLPSWRSETILTATASVGKELTMASTVFFSGIAGKPGNLLHIKYINGTPEEIGQVATVVSGTHLHLVADLGNAYPINSIVQVAYRVRFTTDRLPPLKYAGYDIWETEITFLEDI
jgi:hypothetical protein